MEKKEETISNAPYVEKPKEIEVSNGYYAQRRELYAQGGAGFCYYVVDRCKRECR